MIVIETEFISLSHFEGSSLVKSEWKPYSKNMDDDAFKEQIIHEQEVFLRLRPKRVLAQTQNLDFPIVPSLQKWHKERVLEAFNSFNLEKLAIVVSKDIFTEVSVDQLINENERATYETRYFGNEAEAERWLLDIVDF